MYLAELLDPDDTPGGYGSYILFVVTENNPASTSNILAMELITPIRKR